MKKTTLIYLATPYSDTDPTHEERERIEVEDDRYVLACLAAKELMRQGYVVFSRIAHSHGIGRLGSRDGGYESWREQDQEMILRCDVVVMLLADGADKSAGMLAESRFAMYIGKPVRVWDGVSKLEI